MREVESTDSYLIVMSAILSLKKKKPTLDMIKPAVYKLPCFANRL
jgi:hypothetical protein